MAKNYEVIKIEFLDFLSNPLRTKNQNDFARENKVNPATLSKWKGEEEFRMLYSRRTYELLSDSVPKVYKLIKEKALKGDINWARLYLQQLNVVKGIEEKPEDPDVRNQRILAETRRKYFS